MAQNPPAPTPPGGGGGEIHQLLEVLQNINEALRGTADRMSEMSGAMVDATREARRMQEIKESTDQLRGAFSDLASSVLQVGHALMTPVRALTQLATVTVTSAVALQAYRHHFRNLSEAALQYASHVGLVANAQDAATVAQGEWLKDARLAGQEMHATASELQRMVAVLAAVQHGWAMHREAVQQFARAAREASVSWRDAIALAERLAPAMRDAAEATARLTAGRGQWRDILAVWGTGNEGLIDEMLQAAARRRALTADWQRMRAGTMQAQEGAGAWNIGLVRLEQLWANIQDLVGVQLQRVVLTLTRGRAFESIRHAIEAIGEALSKVVKGFADWIGQERNLRTITSLIESIASVLKSIAPILRFFAEHPILGLTALYAGPAMGRLLFGTLLPGAIVGRMGAPAGLMMLLRNVLGMRSAASLAQLIAGGGIGTAAQSMGLGGLMAVAPWALGLTVGTAGSYFGGGFVGDWAAELARRHGASRELQGMVGIGAGGATGATIGALIGSMLLPGVGTAAGIVIGGALGGWAASRRIQAQREAEGAERPRPELPPGNEADLAARLAVQRETLRLWQSIANASAATAQHMAALAQYAKDFTLDVRTIHRAAEETARSYQRQARQYAELARWSRILAQTQLELAQQARSQAEYVARMARYHEHLAQATQYEAQVQQQINAALQARLDQYRQIIDVQMLGVEVETTRVRAAYEWRVAATAGLGISAADSSRVMNTELRRLDIRIALTQWALREIEARKDISPEEKRRALLETQSQLYKLQQERAQLLNRRAEELGRHYREIVHWGQALVGALEAQLQYEETINAGLGIQAEQRVAIARAQLAWAQAQRRAAEEQMAQARTLLDRRAAQENLNRAVQAEAQARRAITDTLSQQFDLVLRYTDSQVSYSQTALRLMERANMGMGVNIALRMRVYQVQMMQIRALQTQIQHMERIRAQTQDLTLRAEMDRKIWEAKATVMNKAADLLDSMKLSADDYVNALAAAETRTDSAISRWVELTERSEGALQRLLGAAGTIQGGMLESNLQREQQLAAGGYYPGAVRAQAYLGQQWLAAGQAAIAPGTLNPAVAIAQLAPAWGGPAWGGEVGRGLLGPPGGPGPLGMGPWGGWVLGQAGAWAANTLAAGVPQLRAQTEAYLGMPGAGYFVPSVGGLLHPALTMGGANLQAAYGGMAATMGYLRGTLYARQANLDALQARLPAAALNAGYVGGVGGSWGQIVINIPPGPPEAIIPRVTREVMTQLQRVLGGGARSHLSR